MCLDLVSVHWQSFLFQIILFKVEEKNLESVHNLVSAFPEPTPLINQAEPLGHCARVVSLSDYQLAVI